MSFSLRTLTIISAMSATLSGAAFAQGSQQTVSLLTVDPASVATGYRTSKLVGSHVFNEANESVGTIDDLIVTANDKVPYAVLSVGGFLGMDAKLIVVRYDSLDVRDNRMVLAGATKDSLKSLPRFKYSN